MSNELSAEQVWAMFAETQRRMQETDRRMQETDRRMQETDRRMQETDRIVREVSKKIGDLGNRLGEFVEYMVRPAAVRLFRERGIDVHEIQEDVSVQRNGEAAQFDILVVNDTDVVVIECKSKLDIQDVHDHLERLEKFRRLMPRYAGMRVFGAVAAMVAPADAAAFASKKGLFVIRQNGDSVELANGPEFSPKEF